ncbi:MAG: hypothetical protein HY689_14875 [Chloroflexi bacterium]|nr:hypothetical protein [Chloroflexota bacterium]
MPGLEQTVIREPATASPQEYAQRVGRLAVAYVALFGISLTGIGLLVWEAQLFVTLAQRSNVETLALAFVLVFFAYFAVLSVRGAAGAARIAYFAALARVRTPEEVEQRKAQALGPPTPLSLSAALNVVLEKEGLPYRPFILPVTDGVGSMGVIEVDGAEIKHIGALKSGSNSLLAFFVQQVIVVLRERSIQADLDIIHWRQIDDEGTLQYLALVQFARNLERQSGAATLWPKLVLTEADCAELERRLSVLCPALRNEAFLPDWEYAGEHKLPLIPEPLGLVSLSRTEKRVDPVASMGCAVLAVAFLLILLGIFAFFPPWVPGT